MIVWDQINLKILEIDKRQLEIALQPENLNDLWELYNIISPNDQVSTLTDRRVVLREGSKGERKMMYLTLKVEDVAFHEFSNRLRVKGIILDGPDDFVSYGSYHTFNIEIMQKLTITKDEWSKQDMKRLKEHSKFQSNFKMLFIAVESGLANIILITNYSQNKIATIKRNIPGKRYQQSHRNKALNDFFEDIRKVLEQNVLNNEIDLIIICGPGNTKDHLISYLKEKTTMDYISKIRNVHASSGTESAIYETLKSEELAELKEKVKVLQETRKVEKIFDQLGKDADLVAIGFNEMEDAAERGAISELYVVDLLIRGTGKEKKKRIEKIINDVEYAGGEVNIFSSQHPTGKQIKDLGSLVGILRYKY